MRLHSRVQSHNSQPVLAMNVRMKSHLQRNMPCALRVHGDEQNEEEEVYNGVLRKRSALLITDTELRLMASAAIIGDSSQPVKG